MASIRVPSVPKGAMRRTKSESKLKEGILHGKRQLEIDDSVAIAKWKRLRELDSQIRGRYLVEVNTLEWAVSHVLVSHFFPDSKKSGDKRLELLIFVLGNPSYSLRYKVSALRYMVKELYPDLWPTHSTTISLLERITEYRNMLAHSQAGASPYLLTEKSDNKIELTEYKNGAMKVHSITLEQSKEKLAEIEQAYDLVTALNEEVVRRGRAGKVDRRISSRFIHGITNIETRTRA